jgi:hypothetical protein
MVDQPDLFFNDRWATITDRFEHFHHENPHVLDELVGLCLKVKARGYERWSIKAAFEEGMNKQYIVFGRCQCYAPVKLGRGCLACMKPIGRHAIEAYVAHMIALGRHRQEQRPPDTRNRKRRRTA